MGYILGIDIGNSKSHYAICDVNGNFIAEHFAIGANHQECGENELRKRVREGAEAVCRDGKISFTDIDYVYLGVAGADTKAEFKMLRIHFTEIFQGIEFDFDNDGIIALKNGVEELAGIVITCGTGNTNFAMDSDGNVFRLGGLCEYLGDNLGSMLLAKKVLSAAMRAEDGRDIASILGPRLCKAFSIATMSDFMDIGLTIDAAKIINTELFRAVEDYDGVALSIAWDFVKEIVIITEHFKKKYIQEEDNFKLVLDGHIFTHKNHLFLRMIENALISRYPFIELIFPDTPPVIGALLFGLERKKLLNKRVVQNLKSSYRKVNV